MHVLVMNTCIHRKLNCHPRSTQCAQFQVFTTLLGFLCYYLILAMRRFQAINLLLVLLLIEGRRAQPTAAISPSAGYNASLDAQASFSFQCDARGADDIRWIVDSLPSSFQTIVDRGIFESVVMVVDLDTRSLSRSLSISRNVTNEHVTIICRADSFTPSATVDSDPAIFQVQGLLEAPPNLMFLETNDECMRRISWGEPFSLDITDIEPDISHYNVCYSLRNADKSRCLYVNQTEFSFLNVSVPLLFTVSAVNVVGEGNSSSILYGGNGCAKTTGMNRIIIIAAFLRYLCPPLQTPPISMLLKYRPMYRIPLLVVI